MGHGPQRVRRLEQDFLERQESLDARVAFPRQREDRDLLGHFERTEGERGVDPEVAAAPASQRPGSQKLRYFFIYKEAYVSWSYDKASNSYLYFRQARPHVDAATGEQLRFRNVIIMEVPERPIPGDAKGRIEQQVIGEGAARVFIDGKMVEATWRKGAGFAQLQFFGRDGKEIALNSGPVWIAAIYGAARDDDGVERVLRLQLSIDSASRSS